MYEYVVQVTGLEKLKEKDKEEINVFLAKQAEKYGKLLSQIRYLKINVQTLHQTNESRVLYSIQTQLSIPGKTFEATAKAWNVKNALMQALGKLEKSIKKFKNRRREKR